MLAIVIDLAVLGLLRTEELHGYELQKRIAVLLGGGRSGASFGTLYPALARLEAAGAVKAVEARAGSRLSGLRGVPLTGSLAGEASAFLARRRAARHEPGTRRARKVYGITDRGRTTLTELISDPATDERSFRLKVAFGAALPARLRRELFERRRAALVTQLDADRARVAQHANSDPFYYSLLEHDLAVAEHEISWLDELIELDADRTGPGGSERETTIRPEED